MKLLKNIYHLLNPGYRTITLDYIGSMKPSDGFGIPIHTKILENISSHREEYKNILISCLKYIESFDTITRNYRDSHSRAPIWNNKYFPGLDIVTLYAILSQFKSQHYYEVGSGTSTRVVRKAIIENRLPTKIISIDPTPRQNIDLIVDEHIGSTLGRTEAEIIITNALSNDIVFIDGSHRMFPNSDVLFFFLEIMPRLRKGVIVHLHDIYLPFDYPTSCCERFYSEQYALAISLLENPQRYTILLPNHYISQDKDLRSVIAPLWNRLSEKKIETHGCSFWLRIGS
jgi:hypothetical protein